MIRYEKVSKKFGSGENAVTAVDDVSFEVERGELVVLLGPSGCGKTTLLRLTNLLLPMTKGDILVDGGSIKERDPVRLRQSMGYAIQEIGLFPNKTIFGNIATVPQLLDWDKERISSRVDELLEMLQLDPEKFRDRYPAELSGGQQQRIGVARCLAADPEILLMDEPFGAIDPINRVEIQDQFLEVQEEMEKTILFVTHDLHEAIKMGDKIAVLHEGRLVQYDTAEMLLTSPRDDYIAEFLGVDRALKVLGLVTVEKAMQQFPEETIESGESAGKALDRLEGEEHRGAVVEKDGKPIGCIERSQLEGAGGTVGELVSGIEDSVRRGDDLQRALSLLLMSNRKSVCVVDDDSRPVGFVSMEGIRKAIGGLYAREAQEAG